MFICKNLLTRLRAKPNAYMSTFLWRETPFNVNSWNVLLKHKELTNPMYVKGKGQNKSFESSFTRRFSNMSDSEDKKFELKKKLTPVQYHVTQEKGTERPFTGKYNKCTDAGTYSCVVCDKPLFSSKTKFESGCGWPAFNDVLDQGGVKLIKDTSHGMIRTEVTCAHCGAHLGHVFGDGPPPTRKRFCINSAAMNFHPAEGNGQST